MRKKLHACVNQLVQAGYIYEVLALGDHKCMAICRIDESGTARRLDLLMTPSEEYACALLYFTGSDRFNVAFRQYALQRGYTLNEHQMTPTRQDVPAPPVFQTEHDLFHHLRLRYVSPEERVDGTQLRPLRPLVAPR